MNRTELREKLNKIDCENCNKYDLVNLFESVKLSNEDLNKLSRIVNNEKAVYNFLNEKAYPSAVFSKSDIVKSPKKLAESKKATTLAKGFDRNTSRVNEALSKEEYDALRQLENGGNVDFQIANDDGEDFLIVDGWSDVQKIQKALDPSFEPEDEYDTSVLDDKFTDEWGFRDEYDVCAHCNEVIRTSPDSYSWTADFFADYEAGEMVCGDCVREDPANYLNSLINNPNNANTILDRQGLKAEGFELVEDDYENGWYDRSDNPKEILEKALEEYPNAEFIFSISAQEQFRTNFELWGRGLNKTLGEGANSMSSAVERQTLGYKKTKGQIKCNGGAQAKEVEDLLKAKYDNVTTQKGKGGKVIIKFSKNESLGESAEKKVRVHYYVPDVDVISEETFDYDYFMGNKKDILDSYDEVVDIQVFDKDGYFLGDIDESLSEDNSNGSGEVVKYAQDLEVGDVYRLPNGKTREVVSVKVLGKDNPYIKIWVRPEEFPNEIREIKFRPSAQFSVISSTITEDIDPKSARRERMNKFHKVFDSFGECTSAEYDKAFELFYDASVIDVVDHASKLKREYDGQKVKYRFTVFSDDYKHSADIHYDPYQNYIGVVVDKGDIDPADEDGGWGKAKEFVDGIEVELKEDKAKDTMKSVVAKWRSRRSNKDESVEDDSSKEKKKTKNIAGIEHL